MLAPIIQELDVGDFTPEGLAAAGGDVEVARKRAMDKYLDPTERLLSMLTRSVKLATILGYMRWQVVRFDAPALAYSDHPVVLWPMDIATTRPLGRQRFGPLSALEVRVPLAPEAALLMDWVDRSDWVDVPLELSAAAEINAFTVAQADREWMHRPGDEPEVAEGLLSPLSRLLEPAYDRSAVLRSARRGGAGEFFVRIAGRQFVNNVEVLTDLDLRRRVGCHDDICRAEIWDHVPGG